MFLACFYIKSCTNMFTSSVDVFRCLLRYTTWLKCCTYQFASLPKGKPHNCSISLLTVFPEDADASGAVHHSKQQPFYSAHISDPHSSGLPPQSAHHDDHGPHALPFPTDSAVLHPSGQTAQDCRQESHYTYYIWTMCLHQDVLMY